MPRELSDQTLLLNFFHMTTSLLPQTTNMRPSYSGHRVNEAWMEALYTSLRPTQLILSTPDPDRWSYSLDLPAMVWWQPTNV